MNIKTINQCDSPFNLRSLIPKFKPKNKNPLASAITAATMALPATSFSYPKKVCQVLTPTRRTLIAINKKNSEVNLLFFCFLLVSVRSPLTGCNLAIIYSLNYKVYEFFLDFRKCNKLAFLA